MRSIMQNDFKEHMIDPMNLYKATRMEKQCEIPCKNTDLYVTEKGRDPLTTNVSKINIEFNQHVKVYTKVKNYQLSNFWTDLGGQMGLWLGLSIFGMADVFLQLYDRLYDKLKNK